MISRNPDQKRLYDSRLKFQRDEAARLEFACSEARMKGRLEGKQIGQIRLLQQLLGLAQSPADDLAKLNPAELTANIEDLQRQLQERGFI